MLFRSDVVMYRKGKIKGDKGRWFTWQEKALVDREESMKLQKRDAEREFDVKLKAMESGGPKQKAEAELYFKEVSNPLLVGKLSKMFREGNGAERDLAFQLLKRLPWGVSVPAFVSLAMEDSNRSTVAEILEHLQQGDASVREAVLNAFASKLDNPATRDQAAYCMMPFNDKRYTTTLIKIGRAHV